MIPIIAKLIIRIFPGFKSLGGLWQEIIIWSGIIALAAWGLRIYSNRAYEAGQQQGYEHAQADLLEVKKEEWEARDKALQERELQLAAGEQELGRSRRAFSQALDNGLTRIRAEKDRNYENAAAVPDDRIWSELRDLSNSLAGKSATIP